MTPFFLVCAVLGGTIMVLQFVLAIVGFGAESLDLMDDLPDDLPSDGGDHSVTDHGSTALFGVVSFRTLVAALAFFGLSGFAALQAQQNEMLALVIAVAAGIAAMYGVHWLMQMMYRLGQDGTVRIERSKGLRGTVYIPIPPAGTGAGKIQLKLQNRIVEYQAMTDSPERLRTGARVKVVQVVSPNTVKVELIGETVEASDS